MSEDATEAQLEMIRRTLAGLVCTNCGEDFDDIGRCDTCAEKREILRQVFPQLHGHA